MIVCALLDSNIAKISCTRTKVMGIDNDDDNMKSNHMS